MEYNLECPVGKVIYTIWLNSRLVSHRRASIIVLLPFGGKIGSNKGTSGVSGLRSLKADWHRSRCGCCLAAGGAALPRSHVLPHALSCPCSAPFTLLLL